MNKKSYKDSDLFLNEKNKHLYRVMKLTCLSLFLCLGAVFANTAHGQLAKVSINSGTTTTGKLLAEIEKQTDYLFVYNQNEVDVDRSVRLEVNETEVAKVLNQVFEDTDIVYAMEGSSIMLMKKVAKTTDAIQQSARKITGVIKDINGEAIIGANVVVKGTLNGTITDFDGKFSLDVAKDAILKISYIGYLTQEIKVEGKSSITISLVEDSQQLDELIVVGYGTQKKENLTGAVSQINSEVLENRAITNLSQGLQGAVPNLNVSFDGGDPNKEATLDIRGLGSISGEGSSPLVLVDGVQMNMNMVSPEDVASVTVLKDAASAAIYGARGAFGVILITTKTGRTDTKPLIQYSGSVQFNTQTYLPDMLSSSDYMDASNEASFNKNGKNKYSDQQVQWVKDYANDPVNNPVYHMMDDGKIFWNSNNNNYEQMLQTWSPGHKHNISISGGAKAIRFYASGGYMGQDGMFKDATDKFSRYNFLSNISADLADNFTIGFKASYTHTIYDAPHTYASRGANWWEQLTRGEPQILHPIKTPAYSPVGEGFSTANLCNYLTSGSRDVTNKDVSLLMANAEWKIIDGLNLKGDFSYKGNNSRRKDVQKVFDHVGTSWAFNNDSSFPSYVQSVNSHSDYFALNVYGEFNKLFSNAHNITILGGFNQEWETYRNDNTKKEQLISNDIPSVGLGFGNTIALDNEYSWAIRGLFMRLKYDYLNKYLLEINGRYDGTSKFPHDSRFGFFPSVSAGWRVSQEKFMDKTSSWLNDFKFRASYGELGNQNVKGYYPYISTYGVSAQTDYIIDGVLPISINPSGLVAPLLTWETVQTLNLGMDAVLFDKLSLSFDWFDRQTLDMLTAGDKLPSVLGVTVPRSNNADMRTRGWEITANWRGSVNSLFNYDVGVTLADYQSEITKFENNPSKLHGSYYEGKNIGEIWGYETLGIFQSKEDADAAADQSQLGNGTKWGAGDIHYADLNEDGVINFGDQTVDNPGDMKVIGNQTPRYQFGITGNMEWKGIDCSFFIQGVGKRDFFPTGNYYWGHIQSPGAVGTYEVYDNAWRPDNTDALYPKWSAGSGYNIKPQTRFLQSGAYARLKNLTLGYTLPKHLLEHLQLRNLRLYVSGHNLFEITNMRGDFDPEIIGKVGEYYPLQRSWMFGLQISL